MISFDIMLPWIGMGFFVGFIGTMIIAKANRYHHGKSKHGYFKDDAGTFSSNVEQYGGNKEEHSSDNFI